MAEFVDAKIAREAELVEEARKLGLDKAPALPADAFSTKRQNRF